MIENLIRWGAHAARIGKKVKSKCDFVVETKGKRTLVR